MVVSLSSGGLAKETAEQIGSFFGYENKNIDGSIDTVSEFTETDVGTGTAAITSNSGIYISSGANAASTCRLLVNRRFCCHKNTLAAGQFTKFVAEWTGYFTDVANMDNDKFFIGMSAANAQRTTNSIAGFILVGDVVNAITDKSGTEELSDLSAYISDPSDVHVYRIEYTTAGFYFYVDGTLAASHITVANVPTASIFFSCFVGNDAALNTGYTITNLRAWYES